MHNPLRASTVCPVHHDARSVPRPLWESRCRRETCPAFRRASRSKDFIISADASARVEPLLRRGSSRGGAIQNACYRRHVYEHVFCGEQATATAAALRRRCNFASSWVVDICLRRQPLSTRPKRTRHCAALEFAPKSWLVCIGLEIKRFRLVPEPERLTAPGLPSAVRMRGI
jgi:hypothetical protein